MAKKEKGMFRTICKTYIENAEKITWNTTKGNIEISSADDLLVSGKNGVVLSDYDPIINKASNTVPATNDGVELATYFLHFIGTAEYKSVKEFSVDRKWTGKLIPELTQICIGKLYLRKGVENSEHLSTEPIVINDLNNQMIFSAVSGSGGNGLLPNGKYNLSIILNPHQLKLKEGIHKFNGIEINEYEEDKYSNSYKSDETGMAFKIGISPVVKNFGLKSGIPRNNLLIHPIHHGFTDGCIGLSGGHIECMQFWKSFLLYTQKQSKIKLYVTIENNNNVSFKKFSTT